LDLRWARKRGPRDIIVTFTSTSRVLIARREAVREWTVMVLDASKYRSAFSRAYTLIEGNLSRNKCRECRIKRQAIVALWYLLCAIAIISLSVFEKSVASRRSFFFAESLTEASVRSCSVIQCALSHFTSLSIFVKTIAPVVSCRTLLAESSNRVRRVSCHVEYCSLNHQTSAQSCLHFFIHCSASWLQCQSQAGRFS